MNQAVHTSTGQQPFFAFFSRNPPRLVSAAALPSVEGGDEDLVEARALSSTHQRMTRHYRQVSNRRLVNQAVCVHWYREEGNGHAGHLPEA